MSSVWPRDVLLQRPFTARPGATPFQETIRCFFAGPVAPTHAMDDIFSIVEDACATVQREFLNPQQLPTPSLVIRADRIVSAGIIHAEIWENIRDSDLIVVDLSHLNANVLYEFGVAAASKKKERVIVIAEEGTVEIKFDLMPLRHKFYRRTRRGLRELEEYLRSTIQVASSPIVRTDSDVLAEFPLRLELAGTDSPYLLCPSAGHRRITPRHLEFGSPLFYPGSWLALNSADLVNVRVTAEIAFLRNAARLPSPWIGLAVRASHYLANFSNLLYLTQEGKVVRTMPGFAPPTFYSDDEDGCRALSLGREVLDGEIVTLRNQIDAEGQTLRVNEAEVRIPHSPSTRVLAGGRVLIQAWGTVAGLKSLNVEVL